MNIFEMIPVIVGGLIGLTSSLAILLLQHLLDNKGKIKIYYLIQIDHSSGVTYGYNSTGNGDIINGNVIICVPILFEIQNTTNVTHVIRDVKLSLYEHDTLVYTMHQYNHIHSTKKIANQVSQENDHFLGATNGSYSFLLPPRSIQRFSCVYGCKVDESKTGKHIFDQIFLRYYNEKDKEIKLNIEHPVTENNSGFLQEHEWKKAK